MGTNGGYIWGGGNSTYKGTGKKRPILKQWADDHGAWDVVRVGQVEEMQLDRSIEALGHEKEFPFYSSETDGFKQGS